MDIDAKIAEQITLGHRAGELLANPAFKEVVDELAMEYYREFRALGASDTDGLRTASLKATILEEIVNRMTQMWDVGVFNSQRMGQRNGKEGN